MQTFLPYESFERSAQVLDRQRLGKQRVEAYQILRALRGLSGGWLNHPAVKMWRGHEGSLWCYAVEICLEWRRRGYRDQMLERLTGEFGAPDRTDPPGWLGDPDFHASHRSNLLRKYPAWYGQFGWAEPDCLPYVWPSVINRLSV